MAMKLATAYVDITAKDAGFKKGVRDMRGEIQNQVGGLASMLGQLGIGAALGAAAKGAIGLAAEAETAETAFNVIIKDMEKTKSLLQELKDFSVVTPFTPSEVRKAGQSLLAFRTEAEDIAPTLQILGDAAAGSGANLMELIRPFNKIKSVGKLTAETFDMMAERGVNLQAELQEMLGISGEEFIKMRAKGEISFDMVRAAMEKMTSEGGMFFQAMQKQSQTAAGLWSTLVGNVVQMAENLGNVLLPAWKAVLSTTIRVMGAFMATDEATGGMMSTMIAATGVVTTLTTALLAARTAMKLLNMTYKTILVGTVWGIVLVILGAIAGAVYNLIQRFDVLGSAMNVASDYAQRLGYAWDRIKTAGVNAFNALKQVVMNVITAIQNTFGFMFSDVAEKAQGMTTGLLDSIVNWVVNAAEWLQVFSENWGTTWEIVKNSTMVALLFIRDLFTTNLTTLIGYALGRQVRLFVDFWGTVLRLSFKALKSIGSVMQDIFSKVWQGIKNLFAGKSFGDIMRGVFDTMAKESSDFGEALAAGWNKENPFDLLEMSSGLKAALAKQDELMGKLAGRKAELERERDAMLEPTAEPAAPAAPKKAEEKAAKQVVELKLESGFFAFDQMQKSLQEQVLKQESADDKLVSQGDAAAKARTEQTKLLKSIDEKVGADSAPVAAD